MDGPVAFVATHSKQIAHEIEHTLNIINGLQKLSPIDLTG